MSVTGTAGTPTWSTPSCGERRCSNSWNCSLCPRVSPSRFHRVLPPRRDSVLDHVHLSVFGVLHSNQGSARKRTCVWYRRSDRCDRDQGRPRGRAADREQRRPTLESCRGRCRPDPKPGRRIRRWSELGRGGEGGLRCRAVSTEPCTRRRDCRLGDRIGSGRSFCSR